MHCNKCGKEIVDGSKYCSFCGSELVITEKETSEASGKVLSSKLKKSKKWWIGVGVGITMILVIVIGIIGYFRAQANSWETWVLEYEEELGTYYLSDQQKDRLAQFVVESTKAKRGNEQEVLQIEMLDFKEQIIAENEQYIAEIEAGIHSIQNDYDLTFAYEDELNQMTQLQEEIQTLKEQKEYQKALEKINACKALEENIQTVKSGWNVSVVQKDISEYPKVKLYLDIRDQMGNPVDHLDQKIFFLSQKDASNGAYVKKEIIRATQLDENENININLVADTSGSMYYDMPVVKEMMGKFVSTVQFGVGDQIALTEFSDISYVSQNFTSDKNSIVNQINKMVDGGGTKLYDTLIESVIRVYGQSGAKCVIAFTDGLDNRSASTADDVIRVAQNCGIPIFIIGIGYDVDQSILNYIASSTGGYYTAAVNVNAMQEIYNSIYTAQKQIYCLEYQADDESMMKVQDVSIYLRGETEGGNVHYTYTPSDDFFNMLLNNYLNSYIEALTVGDPSIMEKAGYASADGGVYKETSAYIKRNKTKLQEQLLQAEVIDVTYIDQNTYEIVSNEVYDIQWIRDYNTEIANNSSEESKKVCNLLPMYYYSLTQLENQKIKVYKTKTLKGYYRVEKSAEGKWQITDFTGSYEDLGDYVYNAHIEGDE